MSEIFNLVFNEIERSTIHKRAQKNIKEDTYWIPNLKLARDGRTWVTIGRQWPVGPEYIYDGLHLRCNIDYKHRNRFGQYSISDISILSEREPNVKPFVRHLAIATKTSAYTQLLDLPADEVQRAIDTGDVKFFKKVPKLGKKRIKQLFHEYATYFKIVLYKQEWITHFPLLATMTPGENEIIRFCNLLREHFSSEETLSVTTLGESPYRYLFFIHALIQQIKDDYALQVRYEQEAGCLFSHPTLHITILHRISSRSSVQNEVRL